MSFVRLYKFYGAKWGLEALRRERLKISTSNDINDPFEFLAAGKDRNTRSYARKLRKQIFSTDGIISFTDKWSEPLLWSHYADGHRGIALGFDIDASICYRVRYTDERVIIPSESIDTYKFGVRLSFWNAIKIVKFSQWAYESEFRVFPDFHGSIEEDGRFFRPFSEIGKLCEVIIGADYVNQNAAELQEELNNKGVSITTARLAFNTFSVTKQSNSRHWKSL